MTAFLYVYVNDTDGTYRRALDAGARALEAPSVMAYGDRRCMVEDKWGPTWQIATHTATGDPGSAQRWTALPRPPPRDRRGTRVPSNLRADPSVREPFTRG